MCYNCGCGLTDDDMGVGHALAEPEGKSITDKTFAKLAEKWELSPDETRRLTLALLSGEVSDPEKQSQLNELMNEAAKSQGMTIEESEEETSKLLKQVVK